MNKTDLIENVALEVGLSNRQADRVVTAVFDGILDGLRQDGRVAISAFGTFSLKDVAEREVRNPQTGELLLMKKHKRLRFSVADRMRDALRSDAGLPLSSRKRGQGKA